MTRFIAGILAIATITAACSTTREGKPMSRPQPPQDVWQLADRLAQLVPLTADKLERLLDTPLSPDVQNPIRLNGGPVELSPSLHVASSVIAISDGTWLFAAVDVEPIPCITKDMVLSRYPEAQLTSAPSGHSSMEESVWTTSYRWGELSFGVREANQCLSGISLEPTSPEHKPG